jgi:hypothetical protein
MKRERCWRSYNYNIFPSPSYCYFLTLIFTNISSGSKYDHSFLFFGIGLKPSFHTFNFNSNRTKTAMFMPSHNFLEQFFFFFPEKIIEGLKLEKEVLNLMHSSHNFFFFMKLSRFTCNHIRSTILNSLQCVCVAELCTVVHSFSLMFNFFPSFSFQQIGNFPLQ